MKIYSYQKEVLETVKRGESILCNWTRGIGKTTTLALIILEIRPKEVLYVNMFHNLNLGLKHLGEVLNKILQTNEKYKSQTTTLQIEKNKIEIEFNNGDIIKISNDESLLNNPNLVLWDDHLPLQKDNRQFVSMVTTNNYNKHLQNKFDCKINELDIFDAVSLGFVENIALRELCSSPKFF